MLAQFDAAWVEQIGRKCDVYLISYQRPLIIELIKLYREVTHLGLKEAKDVVDGAPGLLKEGVTKDEAANIKKKFEEVGAKVEIK